MLEKFKKLTQYSLLSRNHSTSLAKALLCLFFLCYLTIATITTIIHLILEYKYEKEQLVEEIQHIANIFQPTISLAVWNLNHQQIQSNVSGIMQNEGVTAVVITDDKNRLLNQSGDSSLVNTSLINNKNAYLKKLDLTYQSELNLIKKIGSLYILANSEMVIKRTAFTFTITIVNALIKSITLLLLFHFLVNKIIAHPLKNIAQYIESINLDYPENSKINPVTNNLKSRQDELGNMFTAFEKMKQALTEKHKALLDHQKHLQDKVDERTNELKKALAVKSEFIANMSHEIRTPMNGILGMAVLLQNEPCIDKQKEYINTLISSGNALLNILNDILDFSKMEAGKMSLESIAFDLDHLFDDILRIFKYRAKEKDIGIILSMLPDIPTQIIGDPTRLQQVLMNLLNNALKFTNNGEINITVSIVKQQQDLIELKFAVKDTGIGISKEQQELLFKSFSQADAATSRNFGGTGLGLAICKQISHLMGGDIHVSSKLGEGATFWFTGKFKLSPDNSKFDRLQQIANNKQLLILSNHPVQKQIITAFAQHWGMSVTSCHSIKEASIIITNKIQAKQPLDICLLDMDSIENHSLKIARKLYQASNEEILIVILTQLGKTPTTDQLAANNIFSAIEKPFSPLNLKTQILKALGIFEKNESKTEQNSFSAYKNLQILIAEDNAINRMVIQGYCYRLGITPVIVKDGAEAIAACRDSKNHFDIIFMDCEMPTVNGWEASKQIRSLNIKDNQGLPITICALSAHALTEKEIEAKQCGMDYFLTKPIKLEHILTFLDHFLTTTK